MDNSLRVCQPTPEDLAWLGTAPIPAAPYYDPDYFALEQEAVFRRTWVHIGHISELPELGSYIVRPYEACDLSVLITRNSQGELQAFHNVCPHRGTQLVTELSGKRTRFTCPYHGWTFSNQGHLISAPDFDNFFLDDKDNCGLTGISIDECGGLIFINLDQSPKQDLRSFLGPFAGVLDNLAPAQASEFDEYEYEIAANWKVNYDNFQENYHLRFIHNRTGAAILSKENPFGYASDYSFWGPHRSQSLQKPTQPFTPEPVQGLAFAKAQALDTLPGGKADCKIFPNLFVVGLTNYVFTHTITPLSHNRSRGVFRVYRIGEAQSASQRFAREYTTASLRDVHVEDRAIIERGQRGLQGRSLTHINFQLHEALCRHLFNEVDSRVQAFKQQLAEEKIHD